MKLDKEKIKQRLLYYGLSTKQSEHISEDLAGQDIFKEEKPKKKAENKDVSEVIKE